jgi:hypothetical protein
MRSLRLKTFTRRNAVVGDKAIYKGSSLRSKFGAIGAQRDVSLRAADPIAQSFELGCNNGCIYSDGTGSQVIPNRVMVIEE